MGEVVIPGIEVSDFAFIPSLLPVGLVRGRTIAEAQFNAVLFCWQKGVRARTPKHQEGYPLGYDANITVVVEEPFAEPRIFTPGVCDNEAGIEKYRLEVLYGIGDYRVGLDWDYTYHERYTRYNQVQRLIQKIVNDWKTKGRISGRDYQLSLWDPAMDLEREDAPCCQIISIRFFEVKGCWIAVMQILFRSRDLIKAWWHNVWAFTDFQRVFCKKLSQVIGFEITAGPYIDHSFSLHIYGSYLARENLETGLFPRMLEKGWQAFAMDSSVLFPEGKMPEIRRFISAQMDFYSKTGQANATETALQKAGYDLNNFPYPSEWDE